jgi:3-hydroxybutyryl-CoA dehydrogenase
MTTDAVAPVPTSVAQRALPERVGVIGGGRMGAGIAHAFLLHGSQVTIVEQGADEAGAAWERTMASVDTSLGMGTDTDGTDGNPRERTHLADRLLVATDAAAFDGCDLVVEAVPENTALKVAALQAAEAHLSGGAWLATNTSSLSITDLAGSLARPERFIGLHFFNPVPVSALVEIVTGAATSAELVEAATDWVHALGKTPVVVRDSPGFASSRLGVTLALEAIRMLEEGVASARDIDTAMVLGYKHPVGPLRLTDIVGLDVRLGIAEHLFETLGERFAPPQLLRDLVARGDLGRKSGRGFFDWKADR